MDDSVSALKQSSHQVLQKFGIEIPRIDDEDLNSSTEINQFHFFDPQHRFRRKLRTSTYLGLDLIFQQATSLVQGTRQSGDPKYAVVVGLPHNSLNSLLH